MYGKAFLMMLAAAGCAHADPAGAARVECRGVAKAQPVAGISAGEACALVRERALAALGAGGAEANVTIELDLSRPGSAIARIWLGAGDAARALPDVAVDVMDRELRREDLVRLADAVARAVTAGSPGN